MADPYLEWHKAVFNALRNALIPNGVEIYDYVPHDGQDEVSYPYVVITRHVSTQTDNITNRKDTIRTYLHVFSNYRGQKEVLGILETMYEALHQKQFTLDAGRVVRCFVSDRDTSRDMDELTFMGQMNIYSVVEHS